MDRRVPCAAENNARLCDLVCRSHGVPTETRRGHWAALRRAPDLYPDAVTLVSGAVAEDVLRSVQHGSGCSVKDSFAALDLARLGFEELFEARWIFREPEPSPRKTELIWEVVEDDAGLVEWARAAGAPDAFRSDLLRDSSLRLLAVRGRDGLGAGAVANRTGSVVGVSNVFTTTIPADEIWAGIADALAVVFPSLSLVGYERGDGLQTALHGGFTEIGALRVWLQSG